jgi:hypothetical protein
MERQENETTQENETASVLPAPVGIACQGCKHEVRQVQRLSWGLETWVYCRLLHAWAWAGDPEGGFPTKCSAWEQAKQAKEEGKE